MGSLQGALSHPVEAETEQKILRMSCIREILDRKMRSAMRMYVDAMRAVQEVYGPEALEMVRERLLRSAVDRASKRGAHAADRSLRAFCTPLEEGCRGSHEWEKLEDSDTRQAYRFTRCMWAEIFRSLDAEDIGLWICEADGPVAAAFNPRIRFQRTRTLMEGHDCCDHVYYVDEDS